MASRPRRRITSVFTATPSSTSSSPPPPSRSLLDALSAATERARAGTLRAADAHGLFDELFRHPTGVTKNAINSFLAALARAPPSAAYGDGPALAVALFNRMSRVAQQLPTTCTYNILIDCCGRAHIPDFALAFFGRLLRTGLGIDIITCTSLLKSLCDANRTNEALDVLLHRMPELGAMDKAEVFFRQMVDKGVQPNIVTYANIIHGYSTLGQWKEAFRLQEVKPDVVTYGTLVAAFCRMGRLDDAMDIFIDMTDQGVPPNEAAYRCLIQGFCTYGGLVKVEELVSEMIKKVQ
nr:unnamed protein product [Digitaria exilis]